MRGEGEGFSIAARRASFRHALNGVVVLIRTEHNAWIHGVATLAVVIAGFLFGLTRIEWLAVLLAMGLVWTAEALNTAIEVLSDAVSKQPNAEIGRAKDLAAAGVLFAALTAICVAALVYGRRFLLLLA